MKRWLFLLPVIALAGCDTSGFLATSSTISTTVANILSHSGQACADISQAGGDLQSFASQVAAANPNNASIQNIASSIMSGNAASNSACQQLAASFKAEVKAGRLSPNSHVRIPASVFRAFK